MSSDDGSGNIVTRLVLASDFDCCSGGLASHCSCLPLCEHVWICRCYLSPSVSRVVFLCVSIVWCIDALDTGGSLSWKLLVDIYHTLPGNVITGSIFHPIPSKNESKTEEKVGIGFLKTLIKDEPSDPTLASFTVWFAIRSKASSLSNIWGSECPPHRWGHRSV